jgi:hypothetical protein
MSKQSQNSLEEGRYPKKVEFRDGLLLVTLRDGRLIGTPLEWYPRLSGATMEQLQRYELWAFGIHWDELDEDLSIEGMLQGIRPGSALPHSV